MEKIQDVLLLFAQEARKLVGKDLKKLLVYGFYARGDYNDNSDVDIMILTSLEEDKIERMEDVISYSSINLHFDSFESPQFIFPVVYKDSKRLDIDNLDEGQVYKSILTQYSDWSKQDEWRMILPFYDKKEKGKVVKQPLPKAIYMGVI